MTAAMPTQNAPKVPGSGMASAVEGAGSRDSITKGSTVSGFSGLSAARETPLPIRKPHIVRNRTGEIFIAKAKGNPPPSKEKHGFRSIRFSRIFTVIAELHMERGGLSLFLGAGTGFGEIGLSALGGLTFGSGNP